MKAFIGPYPDGEGDREVSVEVDDYDTWDVFTTIAYVALPLIRRFKEIKHGAPFTDDEDVPEELMSVNSEKDPDDSLDANHFKRWDWIIDEMIYAFDHVVDETWKDKVYEVCTSIDDKLSVIKLIEDRISNGFRLFGKYYQALWD